VRRLVVMLTSEGRREVLGSQPYDVAKVEPSGFSKSTRARLGTLCRWRQPISDWSKLGISDMCPPRDGRFQVLCAVSADVKGFGCRPGDCLAGYGDLTSERV